MNDTLLFEFCAAAYASVENTGTDITADVIVIGDTGTNIVFDSIPPGFASL